MKVSTAWVVCLVVLIAAAAAIRPEKQRAARQALALAAAGRETLYHEKLRQEGLRLNGGQLPADERSRLMREHADLEALRSRVAALQRQTDDNGATKRSTPIPAADWAYAGRASPVSTFESVLWAASHGDVDRLAGLLDFSAEARAGAEAIFERLPPAARQQYGSADRVIATLLAGGFPKDASAMTMIADSQGEKAAALTIRVDHSEGQFHQNVYQFSRASEGWQLVVPADVMADYERILADGPPSSEISTP